MKKKIISSGRHFFMHMMMRILCFGNRTVCRCILKVIWLSAGCSFASFSGMTLKAEYGMSILTRDRRLPSGKRSNSLWFLEKNASSVYYHALKVNLDFQWKKNTFGLGYERVDPDYRSLGGYYFTNDLENFTSIMPVRFGRIRLRWP